MSRVQLISDLELFVGVDASSRHYSYQQCVIGIIVRSYYTMAGKMTQKAARSLMHCLLSHFYWIVEYW